MIKRALFFLLAFITLSCGAFAQHPVFRWDVKLLIDASGIDWAKELIKAKQDSLARMEELTEGTIRFRSCHDVGRNSRKEDEMKVVKLRVRLIKVKRERTMQIII